MKLFAVFLGGRTKKCNIELHDVVFTCANSIEDSYDDLLSKWFGDINRLHIDSWVELKFIDGFEVILSRNKSISDNKLFFINLGGYSDNKFEEIHESMFLVGNKKIEIKKRAKRNLLLGYNQVHTDDLFDVDDCIEINKVNEYYVSLKKSKKSNNIVYNNGYHPIPKNIINNYKSIKLL